jgi:hypothetical protein
MQNKGVSIMKVFYSFLLVFFIGFMVVSGANALNFDFEKADQLTKWQDLAGKMEIKEGFLCATSAAGGPLVSIIKDWKEEWSDYTITVKSQGLVADADWGISFRVKDIQNHYSFQFCNAAMKFVTYVANTRTEVWSVAQAEQLNQWQDFKVDVKGNTFILSWNGKEVQKVTHDALKTGSVGTFNWINSGTAMGNLGGVAFDDFTVDGKGIPLSSNLAVESKGKLAVTWAGLKR